MWSGSSALVERLVCESCQGILGLTKGSVPTLIGVQLFEDDGRKLVLLPFREAAGGLESFPKGVSHRVLTPKIVSRAIVHVVQRRPIQLLYSATGSVGLDVLKMPIALASS
jgi:hypothetical protein